MHLAPDSAYGEFLKGNFEVVEPKGLKYSASEEKIKAKERKGIAKTTSKIELLGETVDIDIAAKGKPQNIRKFAKVKLLGSSETEPVWLVCDRGEENIKSLESKAAVAPWLEKLKSVKTSSATKIEPTQTQQTTQTSTQPTGSEAAFGGMPKLL